MDAFDAADDADAAAHAFIHQPQSSNDTPPPPPSAADHSSPSSLAPAVEAAPSVDAAASDAAPSSDAATSSASASQPRKSVIGQRKPVGGKKGFATKKLGAQKVQTNFSDLESAAQLNDRRAEIAAADSAAAAAAAVDAANRSAAEAALASEVAAASARLAYQEEAKTDAAYKKLDAKKASQASRLGMGLSAAVGTASPQSKTGVSHSIFGDLEQIQQNSPKETKKKSAPKSTFEDDFEFVGRGPKYLDSPFDNEASLFNKEEKDSPSSTSSSFNAKFGQIEKANFHSSKDLLEDLVEKEKANRKSLSPPSAIVDASSSSPNSSVDAQNRFANAKSISSDMFFDREASSSPSTTSPTANGNGVASASEKFANSNAISSDMYFGKDENRRASRGENWGVQAELVGDALRESVSKVAGRLSNLSTGIVSSIQDKYSS